MLSEIECTDTRRERWAARFMEAMLRKEGASIDIDDAGAAAGLVVALADALLARLAETVPK